MKIDVYHRCEVRSPGQVSIAWEPERINDMTGFAKLLESKIRDYRVLSSKELLLTFDNGCELTLKGDDSGYESFLIEAGDEQRVFY